MADLPADDDDHSVLPYEVRGGPSLSQSPT